MYPELSDVIITVIDNYQVSFHFSKEMLNNLYDID